MQIILSTFPGAMTVLLMCVTLRKHLEILVTMCFVLTESRHRRIGIRDSIPFIIYRLVSMQSGMNIRLSSEQRSKYGSQVSFIGSLYEGQYPAITEISTDYAKGYMDAVINSQLQLYGAYILNDVIDKRFVEAMNKHFKELQPDTKFQLDKAALVHVLDQETSRRERLLLLNLLGSRFDTKLYSRQDYSVLRGVQCMGPVDYYREMPYVFAASDINLNISVKGIQSGVPQRAFDILASGGFLLSNYQQELVELFSYGEEMVVYESLEDAVEKCNFYLSNQELRGKIARKGRERVLTEHNMVDKIRYMMDVAEV